MVKYMYGVASSGEGPKQKELVPTRALLEGTESGVLVRCLPALSGALQPAFPLRPHPVCRD